MNLLDELEAAVAPPPRICRAKALFDQLTTEEHAAAETLLRKNRTSLESILRRHGHSIGQESLNAHRDGTCPCRTS